MAGKMCPQCGEYTFFETLFGRECSKCGHKMIVAPNNGKGGKGQKCAYCSKQTVFNGKCTSCGAKYE